ncbi:MAG: hypothetical protein IJF53_08855 [Clostridia bacterium]|nr:hypothetical protein [Clostridia bacterium]
MQIMWLGAIFVGGWFWFYLFFRQFLFDFTVAYPLTKKMRNTAEDLILPAANKYTTVSVIVCTVFMAICIFLVLRFLKPLMIGGFAAGAIVGLLTHLGKLTPKDRPMFDTFCATYYRFVPDDELRTAMYNKKPSQMKLRLHDMNLSTEFIPEFKK